MRYFQPCAWMLVVAGALAAPLAAQEFPSKTVRLVVPFPAAGTTDTVARTVAPPLSKALGQSVVIENRPGGNTRSEEHTSELQSQSNLVCRLLLEKKNKTSS